MAARVRKKKNPEKKQRNIRVRNDVHTHVFRNDTTTTLSGRRKCLERLRVVIPVYSVVRLDKFKTADTLY